MATQTLVGEPGIDWSSSELPATPDDLTPGLLLFFARPSPLQSWAELFGHEWRHIGITVRTSEGLRIASYCVKKCFRLDDPVDFMPNYNRVGVARAVNSEAELRNLERFCRSHEHLERGDSPYSFTGIAIGPVHLMARRMTVGVRRKVLMASVWLYCRMQKARFRDRSAYACSTFVWAALQAARDEMFRLPLSAHPDDEAAYATPSTPIDELYARWLCGPTEIWQAIAQTDRRELDLDPIIIDLRDSVRNETDVVSLRGAEGLSLVDG